MLCCHKAVRTPQIDQMWISVCITSSLVHDLWRLLVMYQQTNPGSATTQQKGIGWLTVRMGPKENAALTSVVWEVV